MSNFQSKYPKVKNYINGNSVANGQNSLDVICPLDGSILSAVPLSCTADLDEAVNAAKEAFPGWQATPRKERVKVF